MKTLPLPFFSFFLYGLLLCFFLFPIKSFSRETPPSTPNQEEASWVTAGAYVDFLNDLENSNLTDLTDLYNPLMENPPTGPHIIQHSDAAGYWYEVPASEEELPVPYLNTTQVERYAEWATSQMEEPLEETSSLEASSNLNNIEKRRDEEKESSSLDIMNVGERILREGTSRERTSREETFDPNFLKEMTLPAPGISFSAASSTSNNPQESTLAPMVLGIGVGVSFLSGAYGTYYTSSALASEECLTCYPSSSTWLRDAEARNANSSMLLKASSEVSPGSSDYVNLQKEMTQFNTNVKKTLLQEMQSQNSLIQSYEEIASLAEEYPQDTFYHQGRVISYQELHNLLQQQVIQQERINSSLQNLLAGGTSDLEEMERAPLFMRQQTLIISRYERRSFPQLSNRGLASWNDFAFQKRREFLELKKKVKEIEKNRSFLLEVYHSLLHEKKFNTEEILPRERNELERQQSQLELEEPLVKSYAGLGSKLQIQLQKDKEMLASRFMELQHREEQQQLLRKNVVPLQQARDQETAIFQKLLENNRKVFNSSRAVAQMTNFFAAHQATLENGMLSESIAPPRPLEAQLLAQRENQEIEFLQAKDAFVAAKASHEATIKWIKASDSIFFSRIHELREFREVIIQEYLSHNLFNPYTKRKEELQRSLAAPLNEQSLNSLSQQAEQAQNLATELRKQSGYTPLVFGSR